MIAMIMPISTNTTIATCIQIHVGDTASQATAGDSARASRAANIV